MGCRAIAPQDWIKSAADRWADGATEEARAAIKQTLEQEKKQWLQKNKSAEGGAGAAKAGVEDNKSAEEGAESEQVGKAADDSAAEGEEPEPEADEAVAHSAAEACAPSAASGGAPPGGSDAAQSKRKTAAKSSSRSSEVHAGSIPSLEPIPDF